MIKLYLNTIGECGGGGKAAAFTSEKEPDHEQLLRHVAPEEEGQHCTHMSERLRLSILLQCRSLCCSYIVLCLMSSNYNTSLRHIRLLCNRVLRQKIISSVNIIPNPRYMFQVSFAYRKHFVFCVFITLYRSVSHLGYRWGSSTWPWGAPVVQTFAMDKKGRCVRRL